MRNIFVLTVIVFCLAHPIIAQQKQQSVPPSDTLYAPQDTIRKVVEIVKYEYEYYEPKPFELLIGTGINFSQIELNSSAFEKSANQPGIPLSFRLKKGNFYLQADAIYQMLNFNIPINEIVETEVAHTITETVVVDTYYRYNNGEPIEVVVTKEVERTEYELVQEEITSLEDRNYSSFKFPVKLGYRHLFKAVMLRADAGAALNVFTADAKDDLKVDFPEANNSFYTYELGVGAGYSITDKVLIDCGFSLSVKTDSRDYEYSTHNVELRFFYKMF